MAQELTGSGSSSTKLEARWHRAPSRPLSSSSTGRNKVLSRSPLTCGCQTEHKSMPIKRCPIYHLCVFVSMLGFTEYTRTDFQWPSLLYCSRTNLLSAY